MLYQRLFSVACLLLVTGTTQSAIAQNQKWQEQETWEQFTDKEMSGGFKMSKPRRHQPQAEPILPQQQPQAELSEQPQQQQQFTTFMPPTAPAPARNIIQTDYIPVVRQYGGPFGFYPYSGYGFGAHHFGIPFFAPSTTTLGLRPITRVIQTGPSKSAGNYYQPSTPDPTASGNFYADSGNAPKVTPVYQPEAQPKDYWGKQGSPLPPDMQPE